MDAIGISLKALVHVMNLFLIAFIIFILAGVSLYQQSFQRRCVLPQGETAWLPEYLMQNSRYLLTGHMLIGIE